MIMIRTKQPRIFYIKVLTLFDSFWAKVTYLNDNDAYIYDNNGMIKNDKGNIITVIKYMYSCSI